jgi:t-SNARE complex subunit (syntaxin)
MEKNRKIWITGISIIVIVGIMYLVFLSAVPKKTA